MPFRIRCHRLVALVLGLTLVGCQHWMQQELLRANAPLRADSLGAWPERSLDGKPSHEYLLERTSKTIDRAVTMALGTTTDGVRVVCGADAHGEAILDIGSTVALSADGYFLTAAHCVDSGHTLIVCQDATGMVREIVGEVIWTGANERPPIDLALVYAPSLSPIVFQWSALAEPSAGTPILCAGAGSKSLRVAAGTVTGNRHVPAGDGPAITAISVRVPLVPGDSGGPAMLEDGTLLGICVSAELPDPDPTGTLLRPDAEWIAARIARDRADRAGQPVPASNDDDHRVHGQHQLDVDAQGSA
jgi:S1-C subfamily serine protease